MNHYWLVYTLEVANDNSRSTKRNRVYETDEKLFTMELINKASREGFIMNISYLGHGPRKEFNE